VRGSEGRGWMVLYIFVNGLGGCRLEEEGVVMGGM